MIDSSLFEKALVDPVIHSGARELWIVSGYATPAMVNYHIEQLTSRNVRDKIKIKLIVGMVVRDGIPRITHSGFVNLVSADFECRYIYSGLPVHAKAYVWIDSQEAYIGSANYTQSAFNQSYREVLTSVDPSLVKEYYNSLLTDSLSCDSPELQGKIKIKGEEEWDDRPLTRVDDNSLGAAAFNISGLERVTISLLDGNGNVPSTSGLNWGQRPGRDHNQAYLAIRKRECRSGFFPEQKRHITIMTDDGFVFDANIAQQFGKAIHTTENALLGRYFRRRLGVGNGIPVTKADLEAYGRVSVDFYKVDDESFYMDFGNH
jgi:hypothetical protein